MTASRFSSALDSHLFLPGGDDQYFATPELTQRLNLILHLLRNSDQLLMIMADQGHGKTLFLQQVIAQARDNWKLITLTGSPTITAEALFSALNRAFHLEDEDQPMQARAETLRTVIAAARYNEELPILLVDDAHMLPLETLSWLMHLGMSGEPHTRLRLLIGCEPQITSLFATPEFEILRNSLIHTLDLPPFTEAQTQQFIQAQLRAAGYASPGLFDDDALRRLYQQSEGVPEAVNRLARERLTQHRRETAPSPRRSPQGWARLIIAVLAAAALAGAMVWFSRPPTAPESRALSLPPSAGDLPYATSLDSPQERLPQASDPPPDPEPIPEPEPTPEPAPEPIAEPPVAIEDPPNALGLHSARWLANQPPQAYTVQLMGSHEAEAIKIFIQKHGLTGPLAMFKTQHRGKDWYVLVRGIYATQGDAKAARDRLPEALRQRTKPWIQPLAAVRAKIAATDQDD